MCTAKIAFCQLVERTFGGRRRDVWPAGRAFLQRIVVCEIDGDLFKGRLEVVQDLLVELGAYPVSIEDGGECVGLVAPHKNYYNRILSTALSFSLTFFAFPSALLPLPFSRFSHLFL